MANAIADSAAPCHDNNKENEDLKCLILSGVARKGAATKGTAIRFDRTGEDGVSVIVDGDKQGSAESVSRFEQLVL